MRDRLPSMRRAVGPVLILTLAFAACLHAGLVSRPTKTCGTTTFDAEVAAGCTTIKSSEVDADLAEIISAGVNNIETVNINASGLGTAAYANGSVTGPKIATGTITSGNILDGTIVDADVNAGAAIKGSKLANSPDGITTTKINDLQVTTAKLAIHASRPFVTCSSVSAGTSVGAGVTTTVLTAIVTTRGGNVVGVGNTALTWVTLGGGSGTAIVRWLRTGSSLSGSIGVSRYSMVHDGAEASAFPGHGFYDTPGAGTHTYTLELELTGGSSGVIGTDATSPGRFCIYELA